MKLPARKPICPDVTRLTIYCCHPILLPAACWDASYGVIWYVHMSSLLKSWKAQKAASVLALGEWKTNRVRSRFRLLSDLLESLYVVSTSVLARVYLCVCCVHSRNMCACLNCSELAFTTTLARELVKARLFKLVCALLALSNFIYSNNFQYVKSKC